MSLADYQLEQRRGSSAYGEVFSAWRGSTRVTVELFYSRLTTNIPDVIRFAEELRAIDALKHPSILETLDFSSEGERWFLVTKPPPRDLATLLKERARLSVGDALLLLQGIAKALDAAHSTGVVHRDLTLENVLVRNNGAPLVAGFGRACLGAGDLISPPYYRSPEQCRGRDIGPAADAYAFGALAYHVLTGRPPFEGDPLAIALQHLNEPVSPPSTHAELPREVDRVCLQLLAKQPQNRPHPILSSLADLKAMASR